MTLTPQLLSDYFTGKRLSPVYNKTKELYEALRIHANGEYPHKLIDERRPHESDYVHAYRKKIYEPITKETISSVVQSLGKIRRSTDWSIQYNTAHIPAIVRLDETLEKYCEENFPYYNSLTNWAFSVLLKAHLVDANAAILVTPLHAPQNENEYLKPYPVIFNSDQILEYIEGQFAILKSKDKYPFQNYDSAGRKQDEQGNPSPSSLALAPSGGEKWYVITTQEIITYAEINSKREIAELNRYAHKLGYLPMVKLRALFHEAHEHYSIYESRIAAMIPRLDEAVREYSDQQAAVVNHLFPERWEFASQPCDACRDEAGVSTGKIKVEVGKQKKIRYTACTKCDGSGNIGSVGPYKKFVIRSHKPAAGEQPAPIPPFGYVSKDTNVIEVVDKRIEHHQYKALCAVNMQFLMQQPLSQSGKAKEIDRDELNNFVYGVAEDLVNTLDSLYRIICDYRYRLVVPDKTKRRKMLPKVAVPEKFDILSSTYLVDEIGRVRDARISAVITTAYEIDFAAKKFGNSPEVRDELRTVFNLDPLPAAKDEEKKIRKDCGGVTALDYIISCNIVHFVKRAANENTTAFYQWDYKKQRAKMEEYGKEVLQNVNGLSGTANAE